MRQSRIREALGRIYDQHPPQLREQIRRLEEDPKSRIFAPLTENYRRLGRLEEAIQICQRGLHYHPDYPSGRMALAKCWIDKKQYEDARQELEKVIQLAPENLLAQRLLGDMLLSLEDRPGAIHHYKMALLLAPEDVALHEKIRGLEAGLKASQTVLPTSATEPDVKASEVPPSYEEENLQEDFEVPVWAGENTKLLGESTETWAESPEVSDPNTKAQINQLLGLSENEDEEAAFQSAPFRFAFIEKERERSKEITTETLADLYLQQGQIQEALQMLQRVYKREPSEALFAKIQGLRVQLGVDEDALLRQRQIEVLRSILRRQSSHKTNNT